MMSEPNCGAELPVPLTGEDVAELKVAGTAPAEAAADAAELSTLDAKNLLPEAFAGVVTASGDFVSAIPESEESSIPLKVAVAKEPPVPPTQEGDDVHQPQSTGGIGFLTSMSAEALQAFDMPEYVKRHNATLTFPEKLMIMLTHVEKVYTERGKRIDSSPVEWVQDGMVVYIRDKNKLAKDWLPLFFQQTKFSSFTRKLYRWGFRQYSSPGETANKSPSSMYFFNENFRRDDHSLLPRMRSVTAAGTRREEAVAMAARRRTEEVAAPRVPMNNELLVQMLLQPSAAVPALGLQPALSQNALMNAALSQLAQSSQPAPSPAVLPQVPTAESPNQVLQQLLMLSQLTRQPQPEVPPQGLASLLAPQGAAEPAALLQQRLAALLGQRDVSTASDLQALLATLQQPQLPPPPPPQPNLITSLLPPLAQPSALAPPAPSLQERLSRALLLQQLQPPPQPQPPVVGGDQSAQMAAIMELLAQQNQIQMPQFPPHSLPPRPPSE